MNSPRLLPAGLLLTAVLLAAVLGGASIVGCSDGEDEESHSDCLNPCGTGAGCTESGAPDVDPSDEVWDVCRTSCSEDADCLVVVSEDCSECVPRSRQFGLWLIEHQSCDVPLNCEFYPPILECVAGECRLGEDVGVGGAGSTSTP